jgi:ECF sigma factor
MEQHDQRRPRKNTEEHRSTSATEEHGRTQINVGHGRTRKNTDQRRATKEHGRTQINVGPRKNTKRQRVVDIKNRGHFFAIAAQLMRRIVVDDARRRLSLKRGRGGVALAIAFKRTNGELLSKIRVNPCFSVAEFSVFSVADFPCSSVALPCLPWSYCDRSATDGSTRAARQAGTQHATSAIERSSATTPT